MPFEPGRNWLGRLRDARGFPQISAEIDLDQFLLIPDPNPRLDPLPPTEKKLVNDGEASSEGRKWIEVVGSTLAELFRMDDPSGQSETRGNQKNPRKQKNPRVFEIAPGEDAEAKVESRRRKMEAPRSSDASDSSDLSDYSRTEVTVIDTSSDSWKSQKIIYRKGPVWKIRDKKSWSVSKKKRRLGAVKKLNSETASSDDVKVSSSLPGSFADELDRE